MLAVSRAFLYMSEVSLFKW